MRKIETEDKLSIGGQKTEKNFKDGWNNFIDFC